MSESMWDADIHESTLPNGIRVVTEHVPYVQSVAVGLRVDTGSRDESPEQAGITHLLEHMVFKGTERRTARQIAEELDAVGGQMDAFTTKEYTGYGTRVLPEHVALGLDVIADMLRHSLIEENELQLEKGVILEEYRSIEDAPEEYVHEVFSEAMWPDHPLGRPVIGRPEVIKRTTRAELLDYLQTRYTPQRLICVAAGNIEHARFEEEVARQFGDLTGEHEPRTLETPATHIEKRMVARPTEQAHFCLGTDGVSESDPDRWPARMLNLLLGGGMSSRLFQEIREKRGLCYSIGSESVSYREGGMFLVYGDTHPDQLEEVHDLCRQELLNVAEHGITADELSRAREQVRAGTLLSLDDVGSRMNRLARNLLFHGRVIPLAELVGYVTAITQEDCLRVAQRMFGSAEFAFAAVGPFGKSNGRKKRAATTRKKSA